MSTNTNSLNMSSTAGCMNLLNANRIVTTKTSTLMSLVIYRIKQISRHTGTSGERLLTFLRLSGQYNLSKVTIIVLPLTSKSIC